MVALSHHQFLVTNSIKTQTWYRTIMFMYSVTVWFKEFGDFRDDFPMNSYIYFLTNQWCHISCFSKSEQKSRNFDKGQQVIIHIQFVFNNSLVSGKTFYTFVPSIPILNYA